MIVSRLAHKQQNNPECKTPNFAVSKTLEVKDETKKRMHPTIKEALKKAGCCNAQNLSEHSLFEIHQ